MTTTEEELRQVILAIRTANGHERQAAEHQAKANLHLIKANQAMSDALGLLLVPSLPEQLFP